MKFVLWLLDLFKTWFKVNYFLTKQIFSHNGVVEVHLFTSDIHRDEYY